MAWKLGWRGLKLGVAVFCLRKREGGCFNQRDMNVWKVALLEFFVGRHNEKMPDFDFHVRLI